MQQWLQGIAQSAVDAWIAILPRRRPDAAALRRCKLVSHRGEHDNRQVRENTLRAFELARAAGVWGIEADIRWTADLVPVVVHDPDTTRVFGQKLTIAESSFQQLRQALPEIPSLAELIAEFGGNTHLMLELKQQEFPQLAQQRQILREHLAGLTPGEQYHLLALDPRLFEAFAIEPHSCCLVVAETNTGSSSEATLTKGYGGLAGHYLLLNSEIQRRHEQAGQRIGIGFVRSRNSLYRELNRGVEWVFSNHAASLQRKVQRLLRAERN